MKSRSPLFFCRSHQGAPANRAEHKRDACSASRKQPDRGSDSPGEQAPGIHRPHRRRPWARTPRKPTPFRSHGRLHHFAGSGVRAILYIALDTGRAGPPAGRHAARPPGCGSAERESQVRSIAVQELCSIRDGIAVGIGIERSHRAVLCTFRSRRTIAPTVGVKYPKPYDLSGGEPWQNCS